MDAPERTLSEQIRDIEHAGVIAPGLADEVAALEQERNGLLEQVFALHDISHTYYGGCKCGTCAKYRALTAEQEE